MLRARRAAVLGISIAEYEARVRAEEQRLAEINAIVSDRGVMRGAIERFAARAGRTWTVLA